MSDRENRAFDELIEQALSEAPPEEVVRDVTPWRHTMSQVLWGLGLTGITVQFLGLNYILPAIGCLLLLCGFRTLRRENGYFRACFVIAALQTAVTYAVLCINTTVYAYSDTIQAVYSALTVPNIVLQMAQPLLLWAGIRAVQARAGLEKHAGSAMALFAWRALIFWGALAGASNLGWIAGIFMLVMYGLIIYSLARLSSELDEAGYAVRAAASRVSNRTVVMAILAVCAVLAVCGYAFLNKYPMDWEPAEDGRGPGVEAVSGQLTELGFPADVLADMSDSDILACEGAQEVIVQRDGGVDWNNLYVCHVLVRLPDDDWQLVQHFAWRESPGFYGTEAIQLWPAWHLDAGWAQESGVTGQVLYDRDGETYVSDYHSVSEEYHNGLVGVYLSFAFPNSGENQRGYITYRTKNVDERWLFDSWFNYARKESLLIYPNMEVIYGLRNGLWINMVHGMHEDQFAIQRHLY